MKRAKLTQNSVYYKHWQIWEKVTGASVDLHLSFTTLEYQIDKAKTKNLFDRSITYIFKLSLQYLIKHVYSKISQVRCNVRVILQPNLNCNNQYSFSV